MKRIVTIMYIALLTLMVGGCTTENGELIDESALVMTINPDPGTAFARTLGATYEFQVGLTSKMPPKGVDVMVTFRQDIDNAIVFSQNYSVTSMPLNVTVTDIPFNEMGTVSVTMVSKTRTSNHTSKTFRLVRK